MRLGLPRQWASSVATAGALSRRQATEGGRCGGGGTTASLGGCGSAKLGVGVVGVRRRPSPTIEGVGGGGGNGPWCGARGVGGTRGGEGEAVAGGGGEPWRTCGGATGHTLG
jgi:hypothetical protein